jgi:hypothetical protein
MMTMMMIIIIICVTKLKLYHDRSIAQRNVNNNNKLHIFMFFVPCNVKQLFNVNQPMHTFQTNVLIQDAKELN